MYDIIVFENLRFRRPKRKRKPGKPVFTKNLYSGERFWKDVFSWPFQTEILDKSV